MAAKLFRGRLRSLRGAEDEKGPAVYSTAEDGSGSSEASHQAPDPAARRFSKRKQRLRMQFGFWWRWLLTAVLCASVAGVLRGYEVKYILTSDDNHVFNLIYNALLIALGINFAGSLGHIAGKSKWLFLRHKLPPKLFGTVMEMESQLSLLKLLWQAKGRWRLQAMAAVWLSINLGAQILIAVVGLTYGIVEPADVGRDSILGARGKAAIADLHVIRDWNINQYPYYGDNDVLKPGSEYFISAQRAAANVYGLQTTEWFDADWDPNANVAWGTNYLDWATNNWILSYNDYPAKDKTVLGFITSIISRRYQQTEAACVELPPPDVDFGAVSRFTIVNNGARETFSVPNNIWNTTTFVTDGTADYGPRSARVLIFWNGNDGDGISNHVYNCNSTVYTVYSSVTGDNSNAKLQMPDQQARIVAGAIGWSGLNSNDSIQSHTYSSSSRWSANTLLKDRYFANLFISRYAVGVLGAMDFLGPRIVVPDLLIPNGGVVLTVDWGSTAAVLAVIAGIHFLIIIFADLCLTSTIVRDNSPYATAMFLRDAIRGIPDGGMLKGEEIAEMIDGHLQYHYQDHPSDRGDFKLLRAKSEVEDRPLTKKFPESWYV